MAGPSRIFVFDAYGTVFDVHSAAREHAAILGDAALRVSEIWRAKQLEYTWIHAGIGQPAPAFQDVTRLSLAYALSKCSADAALAPRLLESYRRLAPFPEARSTLQRLKDSGARLAILSNADPDMLEGFVGNAAFGGLFDQLISARVTRTFKPAPIVYALATEAFACAADDITFVSSNRWDAAGAKAYGFEAVWINRSGLPDEYPDWPADRSLADLSPLASHFDI